MLGGQGGIGVLQAITLILNVMVQMDDLRGFIRYDGINACIEGISNRVRRGATRITTICKGFKEDGMLRFGGRYRQSRREKEKKSNSNGIDSHGNNRRSVKAEKGVTKNRSFESRRFRGQKNNNGAPWPEGRGAPC